MLDLRNTDAADALEAARAGFVAARPKTVAMHEEATAVMPGGNTRTVLYHGPVPLRFQRGEGAFVVDVDGHRYLSLLGEYTAGLFGHSHPVIRRAIDDADVDDERNLMESHDVRIVLHGDADGTAAAPKANQKVWFEAFLVNIGCQLKRFPKQVVSGDKSLVHYCYSWVRLR